LLHKSPISKTLKQFTPTLFNLSLHFLFNLGCQQKCAISKFKKKRKERMDRINDKKKEERRKDRINEKKEIKFSFNVIS